VSQEEKDLATHTAICAIRYQGIEDKFNVIERRLNKVEADINTFKTEMQAGFSEVKLLLERQNSSKQTTLTTTVGTIIVAVIGVIGYLITKH
jgi:hypothetical protein